ncbi:unnamed protein product [Cylindrotheca closterium]|uniref:LIM zinc-binding domain-containing protein n=1 Tax=Cylindrotheca closterium TaxID=2856 RepID=A0AAD2CK55_9STRA|nr:unnamed protein product [Cylindrotheca closterium]
MPPKFGAAKVICPVCEKRVYPMESVNFEGETYHKACMKCTHCGKTVSIKGLAAINGKIYCKPHFAELFKSSGGRYESFQGESGFKDKTEFAGPSDDSKEEPAAAAPASKEETSEE